MFFIRIDEQEFNDHADVLGEDGAIEFTRMGIWIKQLDNGMGCGVLKLVSLETGEVRYICYQ